MSDLYVLILFGMIFAYVLPATTVFLYLYLYRSSETSRGPKLSAYVPVYSLLMDGVYQHDSIPFPISITGINKISTTNTTIYYDYTDAKGNTRGGMANYYKGNCNSGLREIYNYND